MGAAGAASSQNGFCEPRFMSPVCLDGNSEKRSDKMCYSDCRRDIVNHPFIPTAVSYPAFSAESHRSLQAGAIITEY